VKKVLFETTDDVISAVIKLRRGSLFYILNVVFPCLLIFLVSFLGFFLPPESGEKVSFQTTIFLALVVFLLTVGNLMPPTSKYIPLLGKFSLISFKHCFVAIYFTS